MLLDNFFFNSSQSRGSLLSFIDWYTWMKYANLSFIGYVSENRWIGLATKFSVFNLSLISSIGWSISEERIFTHCHLYSGQLSKCKMWKGIQKDLHFLDSRSNFIKILLKHSQGLFLTQKFNLTLPSSFVYIFLIAFFLKIFDDCSMILNNEQLFQQ